MVTENKKFNNHPNARKEIEEMSGYSAPLEGRRSLLRLDFNENTIGPSPKVLEALRSISSNQISIYPEYSGLKEIIIKNLIIKTKNISLLPSNVDIFNGVDAAINAIFHAFGNINDEIITTTPTFGYYSPCADMRGMKKIEVPYDGKGYDFPYKIIENYIKTKSPKILIICNPNNPTGTTLEKDKIIALANYSPQTLIVVDELYDSFAPSHLLDKINFSKLPNIILLRSLSKTAGLAGLRIGYAIGNENILLRIKRVTGPYDVNSFAVTAAFAALNDQAYTDSYVKEVLEAREWIKIQLKESQIKHHIGGGNYFLLWPNSIPSIVAKKLKENGILVRDMRGKKLIEGALRVSIGTKSQMQLFWEIYQRIDI